MSRANYKDDEAANIIPSNIGSTGVNPAIIFRVLIILLVVFLIIGFIPGIQNTYNDISNRIALVSVATLIVSTYLNTVATNKGNSVSTASQSFSIIDRCKYDIINTISGYGTACPNLVNSLYFPFQKNATYYEKVQSTTEDNYIIVNLICTKLYQNVQDFLNSIIYTHMKKSQVLYHFATLFISPIIQQHWKQNYSYYFIDTAILINNIIYIVNTYTFDNSESLETFFIVYSNSSQFKKLLKEV